MIDPAALLKHHFSLEGKTALVTGAAGGIGRAFALALAQAGAFVGVHGRTLDERLEETQTLIEEAGGQAIAVAAELSDVQACQDLIAQANERLGRLDILVNNAGMNRRKPIVEMNQDDFDMIIAANLRSAFFLSQAAHPLMKQQGGGKIIHVGSLSSTYGLGEVSIYGMSKAAIAQVTKTMAVEWARDNIQVNCIAPGFIVTPLTEAGLWGNEARRQWILERTPARRPGQTDDLIGTLLLLASPGSSFLTGQFIAVDGGFLAGGWWQAE